MSEGGEIAGSARYTYRLRVSCTAQRALLAEWDRCRWVWNQCVTEAKQAHTSGEKTGPAVLDKQLTGWRSEHEWLRTGASVPQQQIVRDFGRSRAKALRDLRNRVPQRQRAGMPRYKKKDLSAPSLNYTLRGFRIKDGRLHLAGGVVVRPVWSRELPATPSSVRVYRDSLGHWYCSFVVPAQAEPLPPTGLAVGVDWGVKEIATTTSADHDLPHAGLGKTAATKLARYQRMMARRRKYGQPASNSYKAAKRKVAKAYKKVVRQRQDYGRKWAKRVVQDFDKLAVEDFKPRFLARSTMAKKAHDAAIGATKTALIEMARKHRRELVVVPTAYTSMDCGSCGARTKHKLPLSQRTYLCEECGHVADRDKNAALVMLSRAGFCPTGIENRRPEHSPSVQAV
ncbi:RNA-guided endonuclease InsQ/TnpB family protein [Nocardia vinacea]|uniref:RNA-guided endonuclease InsQ/TnpB family protein n=1 Tax=Nocardia vinacea TaxID=96468 RepID=UPI001FDF834F|nr:transposase [Nocardia vinacea]